MEDTSVEPRAKRQKRGNACKSTAFERLKQLKGSKHKYEISELENVYEVVDEKEYTKQVLNRQENWIVDDDGSGYVEDGRDIFDDDLDAQSIAAAASSKVKRGKKNKRGISENAGRGNLQYLLSSMPSKKKEDVKLDNDDILSDLLSEINESDSSTDTLTPQCLIIKRKPIPRFSLSADKKAAKDYMSSFNVRKTKLCQDVVKIQEIDDDCQVPILLVPEIQSNNVEVEKPELIEECHIEEEKNDMFADGFDMTQVEDVPSCEPQMEEQPRENITEEQLLNGWETMQEGTTNESQPEITINLSQLPMVTDEQGKQVFRFFWWDAFENPVKRPGEILLFGRTYSEVAKTYISCCVAVRNIERKIYLLPRTHHLDIKREPTDKLVTLVDVYHEFNDVYAPMLTLQSFKSRKIVKNYCFDPDIPTESEYLEIKYSAKHSRMGSEICKIGGKTFSRVFGSRSSFLEIFLLDQKIKGPCWLDISNPEPVSNPVSYCKFEVNCSNYGNVTIAHDKVNLPPPLVVATLNLKTIIHPKTMSNEIVVVSVLVQTKYAIDKKPPNPLFEQHFCILTHCADQSFPFDIHDALMKFKSTKVQKMDSERAALNYCISQLARIDPDVIVGHDLQDYQIGLLCDRLLHCKVTNFSRLGRVKRSDFTNKRIMEKELFVGRLVCDIKISAKELIKSRSYDLATLCQTILQLKENERVEIDSEEVLKCYQSSVDLLKLIMYTMQDSAFILKMMCELNVLPLALQITSIAGNVMSRTLLGGRSERNEFLLLHAFSEKNYIVPEKQSFYDQDEGKRETKRPAVSKKKPMYSGGLVLDPLVGFYDKLILLMDFNSLYPSIMQEYNICFTTISANINEENMVLPDRSLPPGILPTEIRKLVESRREVKKLMNNPDISPDLRMQYNIRQMALKLTANSMYGCLGFINSRFYAKNLAALVTYKGREILTSTKDLVEKMLYKVIYGDTDSIMINTNLLDYDAVLKIGSKIKQDINRLYKHIELDIDGVFKYLLLLKKKKYAAVVFSKDKSGELQTHQEHKGLDIVRRDWSQLAAAAGRFTLDNILNEQGAEERIENIHGHLMKLKEDMEQNKVPLSLLVITKQLTKDPRLYPDKSQQPHVQVALRYNKKGGRVLKAGDTVSYVICDDGTNLSATQRAYHIEELKNSEALKIDVKYYLSMQIHPVVTRLCEPLEGTDPYQIATYLGIDTKSFKKPVNKNIHAVGESIKKKEIQFLNVVPFTFICFSCQTENRVTGVFTETIPFLLKCVNTDCKVHPIEYLGSIKNQLMLKTREFIKEYYRNELICEDPACTNNTVRLPLRFVEKYPVCTMCKKGVMYKKYTALDLYNQLSYFQHIFDLNKLEKHRKLEANIEDGYNCLKGTMDQLLKHSEYSMINLEQLYSTFLIRDRVALKAELENQDDRIEFVEDEFDDF